MRLIFAVFLILADGVALADTLSVAPWPPPTVQNTPSDIDTATTGHAWTINAPPAPRKYSLDEIDSMRQSIKFYNFVCCPGVLCSGVYNDEQIDRFIEGQIRTYMANGTDPAELADKAAHHCDKKER